MKYIRITLMLFAVFVFAFSLAVGGSVYAYDGRDHLGADTDAAGKHSDNNSNSSDSPDESVDSDRAPSRERTDALPPSGTRPHDGQTDRAPSQDVARDRLADNLGRLIERVAHRMQAATDRLTHVAARVESRIAKFGETHPDVDLTEANEHLSNAFALLDEAQVALDEALETANEFLSGGIDSFRGALHEIRELFAQTHNLIREAHTALVDAVESIRANLSTDETPESDEAPESDESGEGENNDEN